MHIGVWRGGRCAPLESPAAALAGQPDVPAGTSESAAAGGQTVLDEVGGIHVSAETARLDREGAAIDPHTATPAWRGERVDVGWAVGVLWRPRGAPGPVP